MGSYRSGRPFWQTYDWKLVFIYLALVFIGWVNIYASIHSDGPASIFDYNFRSGKQFVWILTALGLAALILRVNQFGRFRGEAPVAEAVVGVQAVAHIAVDIEVGPALQCGIMSLHGGGVAVIFQQHIGHIDECAAPGHVAGVAVPVLRRYFRD